MYNIISAENYKLKKNNSLKIIFTFTIALHILLIFYLKFLIDFLKEELYIGIELNGINAPYAFSITATMFTYVSAIFVSYFIISEFENKTLVNALSTGTTKTKYYFSKLYSQLLFFFLLFFSCFIVFVFFNYILMGFGSNNNHNYLLSVLVFTIAFFIHIFSYYTLFFMIGFFVRTTGTTVAICIVYIAFESIFPQFCMIQVRIKDMIRFANADYILTTAFLKTLVPSIILIIITIFLGWVSFKIRDIK